MQGKLKNYITIVLDRSSSMETITTESIAAVNAQVSKIKEATIDQETYFSLITFADDTHTLLSNVNIHHVLPLTYYDYNPWGSTALFDAIGLMVSDSSRYKCNDNDNVSFLGIIITDGEENRSRKYSQYDIVGLIKDKQDTGFWTFAFLMPHGKGKIFAQKFGVPIGNIREWEADAKGVKEASVSTQAGIESYFVARNAGQRQVAAFYHTTDLHSVDRATIHSKLKDLSHFFKVYDVPTESRIDDFVSSKSKKDYVVGSGYYLLMKKELIQPHKKILIMEKGQKAIWGGVEARDLIGLPSDVDTKVTPGNHSNYDIFVQSKAPNRKLPRGTKVIYDPSHTHESDPTWDFERAYAEAEAKKKREAESAV